MMHTTTQAGRCPIFAPFLPTPEMLDRKMRFLFGTPKGPVTNGVDGAPRVAEAVQGRGLSAQQQPCP